MKITIVVDNISPDSSLKAEHGFCAYVNAPAGDLLFDSGEGMALFPNLAVLGLDASRCPTVVLSHGHHDHAGGLPALLEKYPGLKLDATPGAFLPKWSLDPDKSWRYAGIPFALHEWPWTLRELHENPREVLPGVWATGSLWPREYAHGAVHDARLHVNLGDKCVKDPFSDEQALVLKGKEGLAVLTGCCHRGLSALLESVHRLFPEEKVALVAGGLHMAGLDHSIWDEALESVKAHGVKRLVSFHCSGADWMDYAEEKLPGIASRGHVGSVLEWDLA